jgi:hypothetical protein
VNAFRCFDEDSLKYKTPAGGWRRRRGRRLPGGEDRGENSDAERAADLTERVEHTGGDPRLLDGHGGEPGGHHRHLSGGDIEISITHQLSNALVESANTKLRLITRMAFGFHDPHALIAGPCPPWAGFAHP